MAQDMFPNSTQTPNVILDEWMPVLSGPEFKIISLLVRQTIGFQLDKETGRRKDRDWLNIKQIIKKTGIKSDKTVSKSIANLSEVYKLIEPVTEKGFLLNSPAKRESHSGKIYYRLSLKRPSVKTVDKV